MSNPWFRMYSEFSHDPKVQMLSEAMQRRYIMLMCLRCSDSLVTLHDEEVAFHLRIGNDELAETKALFIARGFLDSKWNLLNWEKRQFASDTSKGRVAKHRALQKEKQKAAGNADVTLQKPSGNALDTDTDTDTDTDKKKEEGETRKRATTPTRPDDVAEQVWTDWVQLRKSKRATVSPTVITEARVEAGKAGLTLERFLSVWCSRGSQGLMADWLKPNERMTAAQPESFAERDAANKRREWELMTGRQWPADELPGATRPATPLAMVIDEIQTRRIS